jgi:hypothetical protein
MGEAVQALCLLAGANSIFYGEKLLTTGKRAGEPSSPTGCRRRVRLLFGSGYMANLAVLQALLGDGDVCACRTSSTTPR